MLGVLLAVVAVAIFARRAVKPVLMLAVLLSLAIWVVGENFGALATGKATDPNTGLVLALLAATFWPLAAAEQHGQSPADRRVEAAGTPRKPGAA